MRNLIQPALRYLLSWSLAFLATQLPQYLTVQLDEVIAHHAGQHQGR